MSEELVRVRLLADRHTHAGKEYKQGDVIEMPIDSALWLIDLKRAEHVTSQPGKNPTSSQTEE